MRSTNGISAIKPELAASVALHGKRCPSCSQHLAAEGYHKNRCRFGSVLSWMMPAHCTTPSLLSMGPVRA